MDTADVEIAVVEHHLREMAWPVFLNWSALWVGTLAALATLIVYGLGGIAIGAHRIGAMEHFARWTDLRVPALTFSVFGALVAFVVGGWVTVKVAGVRRSESAVLHGALTWLIAIPVFLVLLGFGGASYMGWVRDLAGLSAMGSGTAGLDPDIAISVRAGALGVLGTLLLGLLGGMLGAWMASGEPLSHHRNGNARKNGLYALRH